ncbi:hypothetical protein FQR65_LT06388 [Abscondita terminalis]|nr:hypothetical protein FQR65_LT06388 [Abscondita terminalis]
MTDTEFVKAQSDNLPKLDSFMLVEFFNENKLFTSAEIRGIKADSAGRENYGDAAVSYVQVKREGDICTVKAKMCPEHKIRSKNYNVILTINEDEDKLLHVTCIDCAASLGPFIIFELYFINMDKDKIPLGEIPTEINFSFTDKIYTLIGVVNFTSPMVQTRTSYDSRVGHYTAIAFWKKQWVKYDNCKNSEEILNVNYSACPHVIIYSL